MIKLKYTIPFSLFLLLSCGNQDVDISPPTLEVVDYVPTPIEDEICGGQEPVVFRLTGGDE